MAKVHAWKVSGTLAHSVGSEPYKRTTCGTSHVFLQISITDIFVKLEVTYLTV
ncbi:hypothetical protein AGABI2DRAFT_190832 [Agaricus bisporus var. bisporus H97]|uniref:hypothetical protein n=1 Tax=Agaricus bisporus var. bisporus (strain H97 / ATCC MYA-4626 / FGSC 10389) TaxID=936046 RepID=UPI00029F605F|nr:hypothetical protein AGABI2DRAFT_190832 [Agaricus bisporus var. bisporus H97]EKV50516.1 hypothetical protein AGABI2DRAFT_190832 [Agaricus bisporus var. bisporus H97]